MGQWVKWVSFLYGSYGSWVDALSPVTHLHIYERRFSAFNARRPYHYLSTKPALS